MKIEKREIAIIAFAIFTLWYMYFFYYSPSDYVSKYSGTVLSDNWWEALNWIKNNTAECAVIATYWDPGHFITGIANRPVIFDGATQNAQLYLDENGNAIPEYEKPAERHARIKDIGTILMTGDEETAIKLLKPYAIKGCPEEMYFIASSDLIFKSQWWSYFSTWNPVDKGNKYVYYLSNLAGKKPILAQNVVAYEYPVGNGQSFLVYEKNGTMKAVLQAGSQFVNVQKLLYFTDSEINSATDDSAELKGTVLLLPGMQTLVYMPPELENSMFTRLFFFNGYGLKHFEFVNNWGGEVKLFRVRF